jgi:hypothetical protein
MDETQSRRDVITYYNHVWGQQLPVLWACSVVELKTIRLRPESNIEDKRLVSISQENDRIFGGDVCRPLADTPEYSQTLFTQERGSEMMRVGSSSELVCRSGEILLTIGTSIYHNPNHRLTVSLPSEVLPLSNIFRGSLFSGEDKAM